MEVACHFPLPQVPFGPLVRVTAHNCLTPLTLLKGYERFSLDFASVYYCSKVLWDHSGKSGNVNHKKYTYKGHTCIYYTNYIL